MRVFATLYCSKLWPEFRIYNPQGQIKIKTGVFVYAKKNIFIFNLKRKDARAVEWDGLENRCTGNCTEGSNPSLSAFARRSFSAGGLRFFIGSPPITAGFGGRSPHRLTK